ncbi:acyl-CoA dehydrogenase domain-containing protein [Mycolicibacterium rhodesiae JS60]|nr:acyl-CoA dehydrogenase domain-containing protein [Mycolicibacterium rhodesiae JS60]
METSLPQHIRDYARIVTDRLAKLGGPQWALLAETDGALRLQAARALSDVGAHELAVRTDADDTLAAAVLCRGAGKALLPYPVVDELLALDGARLALIDPRTARVDHGDLDGEWLLADLDGTGYRGFRGARRAAKLGPFVVRAEQLTPSGSVPASDVNLHLILDSWRLLGTLDQAFTIAAEHVQARTQFGQPLASFQTVRFALADASVSLRGVEELAKYTLWRWNSVPPEIASSDALMLKLKAVETGVNIMRTCHQLLGALGFCDESDISVIDRHIQPLLRLPVGGEELAMRLVSDVGAGRVETLFS